MCAGDAGFVGRPIGSWGERRPRILIVGLAPGANGAARSGRAFVGDASGQFLFQSLYACGLASSSEPQIARLQGVRLTNVVKCLPPGNAPTATEQSNCAGYLRRELARYCPAKGRRPRVVVCLGGVAYRQVCRMYRVRAPAFAHGAEFTVAGQLTVLASFHPSRLNVNTGRLTQDMLHNIFRRCRQLVTTGGMTGI